MDTKNQQHPSCPSQSQSPQCSSLNNLKEQHATAKFMVDITSHYQNLMMQGGVPCTECTINCPTYLHFVHKALLCSFQNLYDIKKALSYGISEEEDEHMYLLVSEDSMNEDTRLDAALKLFNEGLHQFIRKMLLAADYEKSEIEGNSITYISFLSKALVIEVDNLIRQINKSKKRIFKPKI